MILNRRKKTGIVMASLTAILAASLGMSVSAASLTKDAGEGTTEVTAKILGEDEPDPGSVSYIITIPDKIDFGTLTVPNSEADDFKEVAFTLTATKMEGFEEHKDWYVRVKVKDKDYEFESQERFFISQTSVTYPDVASAGSNQFEYSVWVNNASIANNNKDVNGINVAFFNKVDQSVTGSLKLNQNQLYNRDLKKIAGEYSGSMIFHSSIVSSSNTGN